MSRAYRVSVRERRNRTISAEDHVGTQLEILEVLPPEQMAGLLVDELECRGFARQGTRLSRQQNDVTISIETTTGVVTVASETSEQADIEA
ncbi:MAG: hypothetical protein ACRELF_18180, partial [Gemmataceae bacterium]